MQYILTQLSETRLRLEWVLPSPPMILAGQPGYRVNDMPIPWTVPVFSNSLMEIEAPDALPFGFVFTVPQYDPAVRNSQAGYLTPGDRVLRDERPLLFAADRLDDHNARLVPGEGAGLCAITFYGGGWPVGTPVTMPSGFVATGPFWLSTTELRLTFNEDISAETGISLPVDGILFDDTGKKSPPQNLAFP